MADARDARKKLTEGREKQQGKKQGRNEPKNGRKSNDPADRMPQGGKPEDHADTSKPQSPAFPGWDVALPPEIRDALAGGRAEDVPEKYRHLIRAYTERAWSSLQPGIRALF